MAAPTFSFLMQAMLVLMLIFEVDGLHHDLHNELHHELHHDIHNGAHRELHHTRAWHTRYRQVLNNFEDIQYSATVEIGGQSVEGILDTGSFEMLVFSDACKTCGGTKLYFDSSKSDTYEREPMNITYMHSFGSGDTWSHLAYDKVRFGPLEIGRQYFWEVTDADMPILSVHNSFQAVIGVGPTATMKQIAYTSAGEARMADTVFDIANIPTPVSIKEKEAQSLLLAKQQPVLENLGTNIFSVCFLREKGKHGYFVWNDNDPMNEPLKFVRLPIIGTAHWGVHLADVRFQGGWDSSSWDLSCGGGRSCAAVVDSGTSLIAVPKAVANQAFAQLNELPSASCDDISSFPKLEFTLGGHRLSLPPEAYIVEMTGELPLGPFGWLPIPAKFKMCTLGFITMDIETDNGPMWILGMPFFREYYTTFHMGDDSWNATNRSLFVARSGNDCTPVEGDSTATQTSLMQIKRPRRVDLSKVTFPPWLWHLASKNFAVF